LTELAGALAWLWIGALAWIAALACTQIGKVLISYRRWKRPYRTHMKDKR
jgi:hypothetical protein